MYKELINIIIDVLKRFKGVNFVRYSGDDLNNAQHNHKTLQAYLDDVSFLQMNITQHIAKIELNLYILGFPENDTPEDILDTQSQCYDVALYTLAYLDNMEKYHGILSLYDYSILTLSHYTGQNNAGVKVSIVLQVPDFTNLCELDEHFGEPYEPEKDADIDIDVDETGDIDIKPISLKPNRRC